MPKSTNKWITKDDSEGVFGTGNIFKDPPSSDEQKKVNLVLKACTDEIKLLKYPTDDVIGNWRVLRFVRNHLGDAEKAKKSFKIYLKHRVQCNHLIEELGHEVRGMPVEEYTKWFEERRNPYLPMMAYGGENEDGSVVYFWFFEGGIDFEKFVTNRNPEDLFTDEWAFIVQSHEWLMWYLNEKCKELNQMCYMRKILDMTGLSVNPLQFSGIQGLSKSMIKIMGIDYCDGDDQFVMVNAPWIVDIIFPIVKMFLTKRQKTKFFAINESEIETHVRASCIPTSRGGKYKPSIDVLYNQLSPSEIEQRMTKRRPLRQRWTKVLPQTIDGLSVYKTD